MTYDVGPRAGKVWWATLPAAEGAPPGGAASDVIRARWSHRRRYSYALETLPVAPRSCAPVWNDAARGRLPVLAWDIFAWNVQTVEAARAQCGRRCAFAEDPRDADFVVRDYVPHASLEEQMRTLLLQTEPYHAGAKRRWPHVLVWGFDRAGGGWWVPVGCASASRLREQTRARSDKDGDAGNIDFAAGLGEATPSVGVIVSNCLGYAGASVRLRNALVEALVADPEVPLFSYGKCWPNTEDGASARFDYEAGGRLRARHALSVASDNSEIRDYVTEKLWETYLSGAIPVYSGAPNVGEYAPGAHTMIWVPDEASIPEAIGRVKRALADAGKRKSMRSGWDWSGSEMINRCQQLPEGRDTHNLCTACDFVRRSCRQTS
jgi:hypothetical protein